MISLCLAMAVALADEPESTVGEIQLPLTPFEKFDGYSGLLSVKGAGNTTWEADATGFHCAGGGDWLEVRVDRVTWPSVIPKKVLCTSAEGKKKKIKTVIKAYHHEPMLVSDGTLVVPRDKGAAAIYKGPSPDESLVVQQGKTGDLTLHCDIIAGPELKVIVDTDARDGVGYCTLRTRYGETLRVPIKIVSVK